MKRLLAIGVVVLGLVALPAGADADLHVFLTGDAAREVIRAEGGHPHVCQRLGRYRIRCEATYWYELHEAEEEEDGTLVNEVTVPYSEDRTSVVTMSDVS